MGTTKDAGRRIQLRESGSFEVLPVTGLGPWLDADQASVYLGLPTKKALYEAVRRGVIRARRLGRRLRFSRVELDRVVRGTRG